MEKGKKFHFPTTEQIANFHLARTRELQLALAAIGDVPLKLSLHTYKLTTMNRKNIIMDGILVHKKNKERKYLYELSKVWKR